MLFASIQRATCRALSFHVSRFTFHAYFGYPTDCAKMIDWPGRSFNFGPSAARSTEALAPVASPSEAQ
jgi:hypothetical protein